MRESKDIDNTIMSELFKKKLHQIRVHAFSQKTPVFLKTITAHRNWEYFLIFPRWEAFWKHSFSKMTIVFVMMTMTRTRDENATTFLLNEVKNVFLWVTVGVIGKWFVDILSHIGTYSQKLIKLLIVLKTCLFWTIPCYLEIALYLSLSD